LVFHSSTSYCTVSYHDVQGLMLGKIVFCARLYEFSWDGCRDYCLLKYDAMYSARNLQTFEETRSSHVSLEHRQIYTRPHGVTLQEKILFNLVMSEAIFVILINKSSSLTALGGPWLFNSLPPFSRSSVLRIQFLKTPFASSSVTQPYRHSFGSPARL